MDWIPAVPVLLSILPAHPAVSVEDRARLRERTKRPVEPGARAPVPAPDALSEFAYSGGAAARNKPCVAASA